MSKLLLTIENLPGAQEMSFDGVRSIAEAEAIIDQVSGYDSISIMNTQEFYNYIIEKASQWEDLEDMGVFLAYIMHMFSKTPETFVDESEESQQYLLAENAGKYKEKLTMYMSKKGLRNFIEMSLSSRKKIQVEGSNTDFFKQYLMEQFNLVLTDQVMSEYNFPFYAKDQLSNYDIIKLV